MVNGNVIGSTYTNSYYKSYTFTANLASSKIDKIVVHFDNDALINGQDRNLYVDHISVNNEEISSTASNVSGSNIDLAIINLIGNTFYEKAFTASGEISEAISLPTLPTGIYLLRVKCNNEIITKKFIKE
ncbi:hypothetical protein HMI54_013571 [Coelomomyces lativittatus]|nr:hypothetical protein HMI54_013571 [Coelomomyces lativittatus]